MAEKVTVKSNTSDLDGAEFINAATEATLKELLKAVERLKPGSAAAVKATAQKAANEGVVPKAVQEKTSEALQDIGDSAKKAAIGTKQLDSSFTKFLASGPLALLQSAFTILYDNVKESLDALRKTGPVGASFNGSLLELNKAAAASGMSLEAYTKFVQENSSTMAALGGTTTEGAKRLGILSKDLRTSNVGQQMMALGLSTDDLNSGIARYIESEALRGRLQGKTDADLRKGAGDYLKQMTELSRLTGESVEQLQKKMNEELRDSRVQALLAGLDKDASDKFQAGLNYVNSITPELGNVFKDLASGVADNEVANELRRLDPELAKMIEGVQYGIVPSQAQLQEGFQRLAAKNKDFVASLGAGRGAIVQSNEGMRGMAKIMGEINRVQGQNATAAKEEGTQYGKFTKVIANASSMLQAFYGDIKTAFFESKIFKAITDIIENLSGKLLQFLPSITDFVKSILNGVGPVFDTLASILNVNVIPIVTEVVRDLSDFAKGIVYIGEQIINFIKPAFSAITPSVNGVTGTLKTLQPIIVALIEGFILYKGVMLAISGATAAYTAVVTGLTSVKAAYAAVTGSATLAVGTLLVPIALAAAAIAAIGIAFKSLYDSGWDLSTGWQAITDGFSRLWLNLKESFDTFINWLKSWVGKGEAEDLIKKRYEAERAALDEREKARDKARALNREERGTQNSMLNFSGSAVPAAPNGPVNPALANPQAQLQTDEAAKKAAQQAAVTETLTQPAVVQNAAKSEEIVKVSTQQLETMNGLSDKFEKLNSTMMAMLTTQHESLDLQKDLVRAVAGKYSAT